MSLVALLLYAPTLSQAQSLKKQSTSAQTCSPISLTAVLSWLDGSKTDSKQFNPDFLAARVTKCGISFEPTSEIRSDIQKRSGTAKLLTAIDRATKHIEPVKTPPGPAPAPTTPPKVQGTLTVSCIPVDCSVSVGGNAIGTTVGGALSRTLDVGPITVSVANADYEADKAREMVAIKEGEPTRVEFKLKPSAAALERAGSRLFQQMVEALGGEAGLKAAGVVRGTGGTLNSYRDGKPTTYDVKALLHVPDKARFTIRRGAQNYEVAQTTEGLEWLKPPKGTDGDDLDLPLRMLQEYQISKVIGHLQDKSFKIVAERLSPVPGQDIVLHATAGSERSVITLDQDSRPKEILLESAGLSSGRKVVYSGYIQKENFFYPKSLQVILPGASGTGFELRFQDVELNPANIKDTDFSLKPGKRK
jgi:hypothetical protein